MSLPVINLPSLRDLIRFDTLTLTIGSNTESFDCKSLWFFLAITSTMLATAFSSNPDLA